MSSIDPHALWILLIFLVILSAFFSGSETAMMAINRYRLRHQARKGNLSAKRVLNLLARPDRLLGVVLLGNTFANILASSVGTILCIHYFGDLGVVISTIGLTFIVLVFSETAPKTLAVIHPARFAFPASWLLQGLLWVLYPLVWTITMLANSILYIFGVRVNRYRSDSLSQEELRTLVHEGTGKISSKYRHMLLRILDLEKVVVEDVMVPRNEIYGIDLHSDWGTILKRLRESEHEHLPLYEETIDQVKGILKIRQLIGAPDEALSLEYLLSITDPVYFVPETALLNRQLIHFQDEQKSFGLVVDEYGNVQGLVTLQDVLEEIVGEFSEDDDSPSKMIRSQADGSFVVEANIPVREFNRFTQWELPIDGPKTLSGLITHYLEMIPPSGMGCCINGYPMEIIKANEHTVQLVQVWPQKDIPKG